MMFLDAQSAPVGLQGILKTLTPRFKVQTSKFPYLYTKRMEQEDPRRSLKLPAHPSQTARCLLDATRIGSGERKFRL